MNINLAKPDATYSIKRQRYYEEDVKQLDKLYHDIDAGLFGESAKTGSFYLGRKAVKDKYPKS